MEDSDCEYVDVEDEIKDVWIWKKVTRRCIDER
jgi:hypothetical protein